ncbi:hypothetical protein ACFVHV_09730, partial [Kitasatospora sp. NPDC127116]
MVQRKPFTPGPILDERCGVRRSIAPALALIDTGSPAFAAVAEVLQEMKASGIELTEDSVAIAVKLGEQRHCRSAEALPVASSERRSPPIVYYIRRGDLLKIGTTVNPVRRFNSLLPDEILAFE